MRARGRRRGRRPRCGRAGRSALRRPPAVHRLVAGPGLAGLVASVVASCATLLLVRGERYEPARYSAAIAVAAVVAGWALAQQPVFLADLTIRQAAAPRTTLVAVIVAVVGGGAILFPSLALLFSLTLSGRLGLHEGRAATITPLLLPALRTGLAIRLAIAAFVAGVGLLTVATPPTAHAIGVACLLAAIVLGFGPLAAPAESHERD